ncbi:uncharacterized protein LOC130923654 [Corythoichthys intestinalis]|uniref:uncharacterized protein LOC130923654 n=1 Tax=Corythoichthys intestinalis TaxID=161448 RepID=UPI0025A60306|nr:uncharacterized protein LOC130923654 [Corythoichthys intestinalis]
MNMRTSAGLVVILFTVSHGTGQSCDGRKDGAECYGEVDRIMLIKLINGGTFSDIIWTKMIKYNNITLRNDMLTFRDKMVQQRTFKQEFNPETGIMLIKNLEFYDSGNYTLSYITLNGTRGFRTLLLNVEAPIKYVHLATACLSKGEQLVSCISDVGDLQYSWALNHRKLEDTALLSGHVHSKSIILKQHVSGWLVCNVRNHISYDRRGVDINTCGFVLVNCSSNGTHISQWRPVNATICDEPIYTPSSSQIVVLISRNSCGAAIIVLMIGVVILYTLKETENKTHEVKRDQELIYVNAPKGVDATQTRKKMAGEHHFSMN